MNTIFFAPVPSSKDKPMPNDAESLRHVPEIIDVVLLHKNLVNEVVVEGGQATDLAYRDTLKVPDVDCEIVRLSLNREQRSMLAAARQRDSWNGPEKEYIAAIHFAEAKEDATWRTISDARYHDRRMFSESDDICKKADREFGVRRALHHRVMRGLKASRESRGETVVAEFNDWRSLWRYQLHRDALRSKILTFPRGSSLAVLPLPTGKRLSNLTPEEMEKVIEALSEAPAPLKRKKMRDRRK